jgi:hypothetical protein
MVLNVARKDDGPRPYADKGTAMHAVAAWCLTEHFRASKRVGEQIPVHKDGEASRYVEFTDDMAADAQEYVDWLRNFAIGKVLLVEQQVDFSGVVGQPDQFGTADGIVWDKASGELTIVDLKTGFRPVEAAGNTQLMTYALGALLQLAARSGGVGIEPAQPEEQPQEASDDDLF